MELCVKNKELKFEKPQGYKNTYSSQVRTKNLQQFLSTIKV